MSEREGPADDASTDDGPSDDSSTSDTRTDVGTDPRATTDTSDGHPYGGHWPELRERVWRRDGYACRRCGATDRTIQAHHVVPRSAGGPDHPDNLLTLCRPCHGVIHTDNSSFDDVRDEAPLFPDPDAPAPVARMREPDDQLCDRCGTHRTDPSELLAWTDQPVEGDGHAREHPVLCKPCAGLVVEQVADCTHEDLEGNHRVSVGELSARRTEASVRPSVFASDPVSIRRPPTTRRERVIDDTPLRFVANSRTGRWTTVVVLGYVVLVLVLTVL